MLHSWTDSLLVADSCDTMTFSFIFNDHPLDYCTASRPTSFMCTFSLCPSIVAIRHGRRANPAYWKVSQIQRFGFGCSSHHGTGKPYRTPCRGYYPRMWPIMVFVHGLGTSVQSKRQYLRDFHFVCIQLELNLKRDTNSKSINSLESRRSKKHTRFTQFDNDVLASISFYTYIVSWYTWIWNS